jgi:hypothetical protein
MTPSPLPKITQIAATLMQCGNIRENPEERWLAPG